MTWAFSDESERAATMLMGVLVIETGEVAAARSALRGLLLPGQRRVHTAKESPRRRRQLLATVSELRIEAVVLSLRREAGLSRSHARDALLTAAGRRVVTAGAVSWVLDHQEPAQAHRDRHVIDAVIRASGAELVYDHQYSHSEPLLWAVDALVWAVGSWGDWQRRVQHVVEVRDVRP